MDKPELEDNLYNEEDNENEEQEQSGDNNDNEDGEEPNSQVPNHLLPPNKRVILDQERFLPIANISRIMKRLLPTSGKVAKEAKECVQECVSEFISFLTSEACDRCRQEKRKTISADDLMRSLINMGFDEYVEPMEIFLRRYREVNRITQRPLIYSQSTPFTTAAGPTAIITQPITLALPQSNSTPTTSSAQYTTPPQVQLTTTPQVQIATRIPQTSTSNAQLYTTASTFTMVADASDGNNAPPPSVLESVQLMVDPSTNQHYMVVENGDGTRELQAVQLCTGENTSISTELNVTQTVNSAHAAQSTSNNAKPATVPTGPMKTTSRPQKPAIAPYQKK